ncbi:ATP-binding protein [Streptomyces sp. NPDC002730]|uniref:ATP-binding protein n=1 Tax=Streptomyces sp. NPDC002730 TaxID=3364662 RepID=UPI0036BB725E
MSAVAAKLIGRSAELDRLGTLMEVAASGRGQAALIEGEAGVGKTALLNAAAAYARNMGMRVRRCSAHELERSPSARAIRSCLLPTDTTHTHLKDLLPPGRVPTGEQTLTGPTGLLTEVDELASQGPLALLIDDLQWADDAALFALSDLVQSLTDLPLLLVAAGRVLPGAAPAQRLRKMLLTRAGLLHLKPLPQAAVRRLADNMLEATPGPHLLRLLDEAAGNPRYIADVIGALVREGAVTVADGVAEVTTSAIPMSLNTVIAHRLNDLSPRALRVLRVAAVLHSEFTLQDLAVTTALPMSGVSPLVQNLVEAGLFSETQERLAFRHSIVRRSLYLSLPTPLRGALHLEAGLALAARSAPPKRIAEHFILAPSPGDPRVVAWLAAQGGFLIGKDPQTALAILERAVVCIDTADPRRAKLRFHMATALSRLGRSAEACEQAKVALADNCEPALEGELWWELIYALYLAGHPDRCVAEADLALHSGALSPEMSVRIQAYGSIALLPVEPERAEREARQAARTAELLDIKSALADALGTLALVHYQRWQPSKALTLVDRALQVAPQEVAYDERRIRLHVIRSYCLLLLGRHQEAEAAIGDCRAIAVHLGATEHPHFDFCRALVKFTIGQWDEAMVDIYSGLQAEAHSTGWLATALHSLAAIIATRRGDLSASRAHLGRALKGDAVASPFYAFLTLWAQCLMDQARGAPEQALDRFLTARCSLAPAPAMLLAPRLVGVAIQLDKRGLAEELTAEVEAQASVGSSAIATGIARHCRGLVAGDPGPLLEAAASYDDLPWPLFRAYHSEDLAAAHAQSGHVPQAREALYRAVDIYTALDASWDLTRSMSRLRSLGVRCGHRGPRRRPSTGWESLTDTELAVVDLVAQGRSNPEAAAELLVSRRTIQTHVSHILAKLTLKSRVEIATEAARHGRCMQQGHGVRHATELET